MRRALVLTLFVLAVGSAAILLWASLDTGLAQQSAPRDEGRGPHMAQAGDAPEQPIAFSHKIHAGDNGIPCLYCHVGADDGPVATIPAVQTCMGCHKMVATSKPEIKKLQSYWDKKQPIPWLRVYDIPDHARFTHKRHVDAGLACQTCHGPIQTMERVKLQQNLTMGFCVKCHKARLNSTPNPTSLDCATCHK
jgi:predicted CXXCH cytochrome family protein